MIDGTVCLYHGSRLKTIAVLVIFGNRDIEVAVDTLMFLELIVCPLAIVDKLLQRLLQRLKDTGIRTLYLGMVYRNLRIQLLGMETERTEYDDDKPDDSLHRMDANSLTVSVATSLFGLRG